MNYGIKQTLTLNNEVYSAGEVVEITYVKFKGSETELKIKGRIEKFDTLISSNPYIVLDISEKYQSDKEFIYLEHLIKIERIKENGNSYRDTK